MKRYFLSFFVLIISSALPAQDFNYSVTPSFKIKDDFDATFLKIGDSYFMYEVDYGPMQLAYTAKLAKVRYGITIHRYDASMKELQKVSLDGGEKNLGPFVPYFFAFNGALNVLYYRYMENDVIKLYIAQLDADNLSVTKTTELFTFDQKNVGIFRMANALNSNDISATISPDRKTVLVVHKNTQMIHSFTVDESLDILKSTEIPTPQVKSFSITSIFLDNSGTKYFAYDYVEDKENHRGFIVDNNSAKPKPYTYEMNAGEVAANSLSFAASKDGKTVYLYGNYYSDRLNEGIFLSTYNPANNKFGEPSLFAYPEDLKQRLLNLDFADKKKGSTTVRKTSYNFNMLDNGTIVLAGVPSYTETSQTVRTSSSGRMSTTSRILYHAGPVMAVFISPSHKASFTMIPRNLSESAAVSPHESLYIPEKDSFIVLYTDKEKNVSTDINEKPSTCSDGHDLALIEATFDCNGKLLSRKKIADKPGDKNYFLMKDAVPLSKTSFLIPVGHLRVNLVKIFTQFEQLATVTMQ